MITNRIAAARLSIILLALLGWSIFSGVGDLRTWILLGVGAGLGVLYTAFGRIPDWIVDHSGGSITDDSDPLNISPRVYLPIPTSAFFSAIRKYPGVGHRRSLEAPLVCVGGRLEWHF
jgi:hypothetical protein